jgi:hypothetical protein
VGKCFVAKITGIDRDDNDPYFSIMVSGRIQHDDGEQIDFRTSVHVDEPIFDKLKLGEAPNFLRHKGLVARCILADMAKGFRMTKLGGGDHHAFFEIGDNAIVSWHDSPEFGGDFSLME